jgi:hypothetical protein
MRDSSESSTDPAFGVTCAKSVLGGHGSFESVLCGRVQGPRDAVRVSPPPDGMSGSGGLGSGCCALKESIQPRQPGWRLGPFRSLSRFGNPGHFFPKEASNAPSSAVPERWQTKAPCKVLRTEMTARFQRRGPRVVSLLHGAQELRNITACICWETDAGHVATLALVNWSELNVKVRATFEARIACGGLAVEPRPTRSGSGQRRIDRLASGDKALHGFH